MGKGSIFDNIIQLNNEMAERLKISVDMRTRAFKTMAKLGNHLIQKAAIDI